MIMFLFKDSDHSATNSFLPADGDQKPGSFWRRLLFAMTGEENPMVMKVLLGILVAALHLWLSVQILQPRPQEKITEAQPLPIEVALVPPAPVIEPPAPPPPQPPVQKKPEPKPKPVKKIAPKPKPVPKKAVLPAPEQETQPVTQPQPPVADSAPAPAPPAPKSATPPKETFTEANFHANYGYNPDPKYPQIAKSRGWEGRVLLRVHVSAEGHSTGIEIQQSSGHDILDESAVEAVNKWKFIPAKRGETPVASTVVVPINFTLKN
ncbi:MAG: energy transducer TonB [Methylobacter sp.]|nr:MAG: energy transducer TonB [Methylobacter sp.]